MVFLYPFTWFDICIDFGGSLVSRLFFDRFTLHSISRPEGLDGNVQRFRGRKRLEFGSIVRLLTVGGAHEFAPDQNWDAFCVVFKHPTVSFPSKLQISTGVP